MGDLRQLFKPDGSIFRLGPKGSRATSWFADQSALRHGLVKRHATPETARRCPSPTKNPDGPFIETCDTYFFRKASKASCMTCLVSGLVSNFNAADRLGATSGKFNLSAQSAAFRRTRWLLSFNLSHIIS